MRLITLALALCMTAETAIAGPYTEAGIAGTDPRFVGWATGVSSLVRGPQDIADPNSALADFGDASSALGAPGGVLDVVSLGDGGRATLTFAAPIHDGAGPDFAVFENGFGDATQIFGEFAYVDVSSDNVNFFRFASVSLTPSTSQIGTFGMINPTDISNLAGKHVAGIGTPFDLASMTGVSPLLNINRVTSVRVTDVVGIINSPFTRFDSLGNAINDPYSTPFASGGFDLDAVGVINSVVPEPGFLGALAFLIPAFVRRSVRAGAFSPRKQRITTRRAEDGPAVKVGSMCAFTLLACLALVSPAFANGAATFEDFPLPSAGYFNGGPTTNAAGFTNGGSYFRNSYNSSFGGYWSGFSVSNINNTMTAGVANQYASYAGDGAGGSAKYAVAYPTAYINLAANETPVSIALTNTTYAALSIKNGDSFSKKFGGSSGNDPDRFAVKLTGFSGAAASGTVTGSSTLVLADYTFVDNAQDYILNTWSTVDLTGLGAARSIGITFESTDVGQFGINTPTYVALDNVVTVPEPALLTAIAFSLATTRRRR